ncbi:MAG: hypothetical protein ACI8ZB_003638 [Desulforhopalus sp.]|jgi:hypothetical protein
MSEELQKVLLTAFVIAGFMKFCEKWLLLPLTVDIPFNEEVFSLS